MSVALSVLSMVALLRIAIITGNISASGDNSDFLGGIAGYTTAPISYCASLKDKTIEGSNQVGGIVGKASWHNAKSSIAISAER